MGRRKKEPVSAHRAHIMAAASALFLAKGVPAVSMDEIAKAAGYSKASLYVYFENKDEIIRVLVLDSMKKLAGCVRSALKQQASTRAKYDCICRQLAQYQQQYPFYFQATLEKINIDFEKQGAFPEERETFLVGEQINEMIRGLLLSGMEKGELRRDLAIEPASFSCWGMLAGLISFAANKEQDIQSAMGLSREQFLQHGFDLLYRSLESPPPRKGDADETCF